MEPAKANLVLELVVEALERTGPARSAFLMQACGEDETLRAEVQSLVDYQEKAREFLEAPVFDLEGAEFQDGQGSDLQTGHMLGDYRVTRLLGVGGMGEVYLAEDTKLERKVAVKLLKRHLDNGLLLRRFRHERKVLAGLTHPNIARLYDGAITPEGRAYLVMEYVEGERLDEYCNQRQSDVAERLAIFSKVCAAVSYAHQNLVVHRDLKPANIRVTAEGEPKLLDFGIAKLLESETAPPEAGATLTMQAMMTPEYASPEQLRNEPITTATDVYSLGVVFYELLTGQRPYQVNKRRPEELARAICEQEPVRPSTVIARLSSISSEGLVCGERTKQLRRRLEGDLDNIVSKAMRKEPARRYSSAAQFAEDIRRHGQGLGVIARKDTLGYRTDKFVRRNKTAVAAAAFVALALVGGLVVASWQARVARRERDRARLAERQADRLNNFLEDLLSSADPAKMGKDVKVVQVLDAAGKNLDRELGGEPEILAQAHETLRRVYSRLGLLEPAEQQARAALSILRHLHGDADSATVRAKRRLADVLSNRYLFTQAEPLQREALAAERRQTLPDNVALAQELDSLGYTLIASGRSREAEPMVEEALARIRAARGENNLESVSTLVELGSIKAAEKDYDAAEAIYRRVIAQYARLSPNDSRCLSPQINLCICLFAQQKLSELEKAVPQLEHDSLQITGESSLYYGVALFAHGCVDFAEGNYTGAVPRLRQALGPVAAAYPSGQITVVQCRALLGLCLTRTGRADEGEPYLRLAFEHGQKADKTDFLHTIGNLETALGECLLAQKHYTEAEPLLLSGYDELKARLGASNAMTNQAARLLHDLYTAWNKPAEAAHFATNVNAAPTPVPAW